jgi:hypothetical protein
MLRPSVAPARTRFEGRNRLGSGQAGASSGQRTGTRVTTRPPMGAPAGCQVGGATGKDARMVIVLGRVSLQT